MYFTDEMQMLSHLNDDWSILLQNIRKRQAIHLALLSHNFTIISTNHQQLDLQELQSENVQYEQTLLKTLQESKQLEQQEKEIVQKYTNTPASYEGVYKFMTRVATAFIDILEQSLHQLKQYNPSLVESTASLKRNIVNLLTQKQTLDLAHIINVALDFTKQKMQTEINKLQALLKALQNQEYHLLQSLYTPEPQPNPEKNSPERHKQIMVERKRQFSLNKEDRDQSAKTKNNLKKQKIKFFDNLYGIMILSKYQWVDDNQEAIDDKKQKLFSELLKRNRVNNEHIVRFSKQTEESQQKIKQLQPAQLQKQRVSSQQSDESPKKPSSNSPIRIHIQNKSAKDTISKRPKTKLVQSVMFHDYLLTESENCHKTQGQLEEEGEDKVKRMSTMCSGKNKLNDCELVGKQFKDFPQIMNKTIQNQFCTFKLQSIKNVSYESRKAKLPDINQGACNENRFSLRIPKPAFSRGTSREEFNNMEEEIINTYNQKERWLKEDRVPSQRAKITLKNIQVGTDLHLKKESFSLKKDERMKSHERMNSYERKKTDSALLQSTAYCKRTLNKFLDTKLNVF